MKRLLHIYAWQSDEASPEVFKRQRLEVAQGDSPAHAIPNASRKRCFATDEPEDETQTPAKKQRMIAMEAVDDTPDMEAQREDWTTAPAVNRTLLSPHPITFAQSYFAPSGGGGWGHDHHCFRGVM